MRHYFPTTAARSVSTGLFFALLAIPCFVLGVLARFAVTAIISGDLSYPGNPFHLYYLFDAGIVLAGAALAVGAFLALKAPAEAKVTGILRGALALSVLAVLGVLHALFARELPIPFLSHLSPAFFFVVGAALFVHALALLADHYRMWEEATTWLPKYTADTVRGWLAILAVFEFIMGFFRHEDGMVLALIRFVAEGAVMLGLGRFLLRYRRGLLEPTAVDAPAAPAVKESFRPPVGHAPGIHTLPAASPELAKTVEGVGKLRASFNSNRWIKLFFVGLGFSLGALFLLICLVAYISSQNAGGLIGVGIFGLCAFVIGKELRSHWQKMGWFVEVHEGGLVSRKRDEVKVIPWDDILSVRSSVTEHYTRNQYGTFYRGRTHSYYLHLTDGTELRLDEELKHVGQLGPMVEEEVFARLLPRSADAFNAGEMLDFDAVKMSRSGLKVGEQSLRWEEVDRVSLSEGKVEVRGNGGRFDTYVYVSSTLNFPIFWTLVKNLLGPMKVA
jgi:hypothetical protein